MGIHTSPIIVTLVPCGITWCVCCPGTLGQQKEGKASRMAGNEAKAENTWFMEKQCKEDSSRGAADKIGTQNFEHCKNMKMTEYWNRSRVV